MIKKKLNILLLLSLALLFTSLLGTTCFARTVTAEDLQNFTLNSYLEDYGEAQDTTNIVSFINENYLNYVSVANILNQYEGYYAISRSGYNLFFWYITGSQTNLNNYHPWYRQDGYNYITVNSSYLTKHRLSIDFRDGRYKFSSSWTNYDLNLPQTGRVFYTDIDIYNNSNFQSVLFPAGYMSSSDIFDNIFNASYFDIDINADFRNNKATISNDTSGTEYYLIPYTSDKVRIGNMFDYSNLSSVIKRKFRYKQSTRSFDPIQEYESNTNNLDFYDIADDTLIVFEYCQPDTTEFITFVPKADTGFSQFTVPIYYTSANTSVVNGVIDTGDTFSGDNYNNYNNDTNTDKIIDNINNDNEVDSTLNEFISGDAEDIANKFGFRLFNQEYYDFIYNTIVSITNVLTDDSDVYFDYSMHGEAPTRIYASSFTTPNGTLKTFLTMFLVSCTVFAFYKYIADLLELISTGNILEALDEFKVDRNIFKM